MGFFDELEWDPSYVPSLKLGLHIAQIFFSVVVWILEIVVFRADGSAVVGQNGWTFAVCFLSVPAWVYLIGTPRFPRTQKWANVYAMATVDGVFTILWLSAFATQAAYNSADLCGTACGASKGIVALGVFVFLLFAGTTVLSLYTVQYWSQEGSLPGYSTERRSGFAQNIDPDKAAFSAAPHGADPYMQVPDQDHDTELGHPGAVSHADDPYNGPGYTVPGSTSGGAAYGDAQTAYTGSTSNISHDPYAPPAQNPFGGAAHEDPFHDGHGYNAGTGAAAAGGHYAPPTAQDEYDEERPAQFPNANYDRINRFGQAS